MLCDWGESGALPSRKPARGSETFLLGHDIPSSDDEGHPSGADLSELQDPSPWAVSQVRNTGHGIRYLEQKNT